MRLKLILLVPFLLVGSIVLGQLSLEQERMTTINPYWKHVSLTTEQSQHVNQCHSNTLLIQLHLKWVSEYLIASSNSMDLDAETILKRQKMIEALTGYYQRCLFPINTVSQNATPVFVDEVGTHCAVGYLIHVSGYDDVVQKISEENNLGYVYELNQQYQVLGSWAEEYGFTIDELAWIQPQYSFSCNPGIQLGEVIHVTCPGDCSGAFFADPLEANLEPGSIIQVGSVFEWSNGEWREISGPDCLCAGLYKQEYIVTSVVMDTTYIVGIETEIIEPEPIYSYANIETEPGFCNTYIEAESQGGTPPYSYSIYDMDDNEYNLDLLCDGEYYLVTIDSAGCSIAEEFDLHTWEEDCQMFCVTDIQLTEPGNMAVTLYFDAPGDVFINYPYFSLVFDENNQVVANGGLDFFGQFGGTSQTYMLQSTLESLPPGFTASLSFEYNEQFCSLSYPCTTTSFHTPETLDMNIYPNPISSEAVIQLDEPLSGGSVTLYNMQGQKVKSYTWLSGDQFTFNVNGLPSGPYLIQVSSPDKRAMGKCIIMD